MACESDAMHEMNFSIPAPHTSPSCAPTPDTRANRGGTRTHDKRGMRDLQYKAISNYPDKERKEGRERETPDMISYINDSQIEAMNRRSTKGSPVMRREEREIHSLFLVPSIHVSIHSTDYSSVLHFHRHRNWDINDGEGEREETCLRQGPTPVMRTAHPDSRPEGALLPSSDQRHRKVQRAFMS